MNCLIRNWKLYGVLTNRLFSVVREPRCVWIMKESVVQACCTLFETRLYYELSVKVAPTCFAFS